MFFYNRYNINFFRAALYGAMPHGAAMIRMILPGLAAVLLVLSCPSPAGSGGGGGGGSASGNLNGVWTFHYKGNDTTQDPPVYYDYVTTIKIANGTYEYGDTQSGGYAFWYKGQIANSPEYTAASGVLIIKFTAYTADSTRTGKYGAVYWTQLTANSVRMADAWTGPPYVHTLFDTLQEARTNFTIDRMGDYIDWSITSPYAK
jgi:hypothetical protein